MENNKDQFQNAQQGTGSAEDKGQSRNEQQNHKTILTDEERENLAGQMGERSNSLVGLKDMGALSGRDDAAGGSADRMEDTSSGEPTDR